jgi:hypothetical protein
MQSKWQKFSQYYSMIAGYLFVWIVLGNLLGYVLSEHLYYVFYSDELLIEDISDQHYLRHEKCYPVSSYGYEAKCENQFLQWFWIILVSIPSVLMLFIEMNISFVYVGFTSNSKYFLWALGISKFSAFIIVLIVLPAISYWWKRNRKIAYFSMFLFLCYCVIGYSDK